MSAIRLNTETLSAEDSAHKAPSLSNAAKTRGETLPSGHQPILSASKKQNLALVRRKDRSVLRERHLISPLLPAPLPNYFSKDISKNETDQPSSARYNPTKNKVINGPFS